jgi:hypothetical protein
VSSTRSRKQPRSRRLFGVPLREYLPFVLLSGGAAVLLERAAAAGAGWLGLTLAAVGGALLPLAYTVKLAREGRLFLRGAAVAENRERIDRVAIPVGWLLAPVFLVLAGSRGGGIGALGQAFAGGVVLGLVPGLGANLVRLRRERWWDD